jgi:hypothetical protein
LPLWQKTLSPTGIFSTVNRSRTDCNVRYALESLIAVQLNN